MSSRRRSFRLHGFAAWLHMRLEPAGKPRVLRPKIFKGDALCTPGIEQARKQKRLLGFFTIRQNLLFFFKGKRRRVMESFTRINDGTNDEEARLCRSVCWWGTRR